MNTHEAPAYFCVTDGVAEPPAAESCTEGRLFLDDEELVCGGGDPDVQSGYIGRVDSHAGSTVRRLLGTVKGFQEFDLVAARGREATRSVGLDAITAVDVVEWEGSELKGADGIYGVRVNSRQFRDGALMVQLGRGWRNRGSGRNRHVALARLVRAKAGGLSDAATTGELSAVTDADGLSESGTIDGPSDGTTGEPADADDAEDQLPWLTDEDESTTLIARNYGEYATTARIGCRTDEGVEFREEVTLGGMEREQWTDLPEGQSFEIGVVPEDGEGTGMAVEDTEAIEGDIHVYLTPEEATIGTSSADSPATDQPNGPSTTADSQRTTGGRQQATKTSNRQRPTTDRQQATSDDRRATREDASKSAADAGGSLLGAGGILAVGLVVWFGSPALDPGVLLPIFDMSPRTNPSLAEQLTGIREVVAVGGAFVTFYGLYRVVKAR